MSAHSCLMLTPIFASDPPAAALTAVVSMPLK
jgi:hypothetical protein